MMNLKNSQGRPVNRRDKGEYWELVIIKGNVLYHVCGMVNRTMYFCENLYKELVNFTCKVYFYTSIKLIKNGQKT